jgi:beta-phosphoglucomutase-like phosphatase (HAD superfamily)
MAYDLIIFDCDGTLVDSEYLNNKVVADQLAELGLPQYDTAHNIAAFAGKGMHEVINTVKADTGRDLPANFTAEYSRRVNEGLAEHMKVIDDVHETLRHFHGRVKICVGSNGERSNVTRMIEVGGMTEFFPEAHIFTKDMVRNAKPAPDLFLFAAAKMGAPPARTLVIEDSITGAAAGVAAGMIVVGFTGSVHDRAAQEKALRRVGAHYITACFADIMALAAPGFPA